MGTKGTVNFMAKLQKMEGAVIGNYNPHSEVIQTPSPSANFIFGNGWGLPSVYTQVLYGPPKGGKSIICFSAIGCLHQADPEAWAIKFDTELREQGQLTPETTKMWGIDRNRYMCFGVNQPDLVFDRIEKDIAALCDEGMKLKLVIIDSLTGIQGRRAMNADSIMTQQIGDVALTLQEGLKRILPVQRKYRFALMITAHVRAEMDLAEQMRGNKVKMAAGFGVQHFAEYFTYVEPWKAAKGREDLNGKKLENTSIKNIGDDKKGEVTGHKIRIVMKESSMGPKGRTGIFTLDYKKGIINTHEEVFLLGVNTGVITKPTNQSYVYGDKKWVGKEATLEALRSDPDLCKVILNDMHRRDLDGTLGMSDEDNLETADTDPKAGAEA